MSSIETSKLYTTGEVARMFRVDRKTVLRWAEQKRIPAQQVITTPGGHRRFKADYIDGILK